MNRRRFFSGLGTAIAASVLLGIDCCVQNDASYSTQTAMEVHNSHVFASTLAKVRLCESKLSFHETKYWENMTEGRALEVLKVADRWPEYARMVGDDFIKKHKQFLAANVRIDFSGFGRWERPAVSLP